jgi:preprotein translocase subunit SecE
MKKFTTYLKVSYDELVNKTSWPSWQELQNSAIVVFVATLIIAIIIALMDGAFKNIMHVVYSMFY